MNQWEKIITTLGLNQRAGPPGLESPVRGAYCGDLLSDVLARASPGDLWITIHRHRNIVAVATLANLAGIIITGGREPDPDTREAAEKENLPLFTTSLNSFQAAGKLYVILSEYSLFSEKTLNSDTNA